MTRAAAATTTSASATQNACHALHIDGRAPFARIAEVLEVSTFGAIRAIETTPVLRTLKEL